MQSPILGDDVRVTRGFWTIIALGVFLLIGGVTIQSQILIIGGIVLGIYLVYQQYIFIRDIQRLLPELDVRIEMNRIGLVAGETSQVQLSAALSETSKTDLEITIQAETPLGARGQFPNIALNSMSKVSHSVEVHWPLAGKFEFDEPRVRFTDQFGLFTQTISHGEIPTVNVEPEKTLNLHVGQGGTDEVRSFGDHTTDQTGSGLTPADVRKYIPGDAARRIDWKATARLAEPHIREFELEQSRETRLFLDHRTSMGDGAKGRTKLDYARQVALAFIDQSQKKKEQLGCYMIGSQGITKRVPASAASEHWIRVKDEVFGMVPSEHEKHAVTSHAPSEARNRAESLESEISEFAARLQPYFQNQDQYIRRIEDQPLFTALKLYQASHSDVTWTVIMTDDTNRAELKETVKFASQTGNYVSVYITPTVLFQDGELSEFESAYQEYVEFEEFRQELELQPRVDAFEVGPGDRLQAILSQNSPELKAGEDL
jgi:uncharacterized protein (DUF58 family)